MKQEVGFLGSFDPNTNVIRTKGDGHSQLVITTDATQLAKALTAVAVFKGKLFKVKLTLAKGSQNGKKKASKKLR